jgi:hypothetical protein
MLIDSVVSRIANSGAWASKVVILPVKPRHQLLNHLLLAKGRWPVQRQESAETDHELAQPSALAPSRQGHRFEARRDLGIRLHRVSASLVPSAMTGMRNSLLRKLI